MVRQDPGQPDTGKGRAENFIILLDDSVEKGNGPYIED